MGKPQKKFQGRFAQKVDDLIEKMQEDVEHLRFTMGRDNLMGFLGHLDSLKDRCVRMAEIVKEEKGI